jgi:iron complex transport system ATP-binding protein
MTAAISCRDISVVVEQQTLLDAVSVDVATNEWLCVLGPNGAGKTTLLRAITGALQTASGEIALMGRLVTSMRARERARLVAVVPQVPVIPPGMEVLDYVLLGRTPYHGLLSSIDGRDVEIATAALRDLELDRFSARRVDSLSGGERQRVIVARALAQEAPVLLLDEPTASLDIGHQQDVLELVDRLRRVRDLTVVSTMHDLTLAAQYGDRLLLIREGRVVCEGDAADVMTSENLERYFGARVAVIDGPYGRAIVPYRSTREEQYVDRTD